MKRTLCLALILSLLLAMCLPAAVAEEEWPEDNDIAESEVVAADDAGDTGLTIEGAEDDIEEEPMPMPGDEDEEALEPADEAEAAPEDEAPADGEALAVAAPEILSNATGIKLSASTVAIGVKENYAGLTVVPVPAESAVPAVTWRSSNEKYVKVDAQGRLTGVKKGSATIYAKMKNGKEASCKVSVRKAPKKLSVTPKKLKLGADGQTAQLQFSVPKGSASNTFTYSSSNTNVAKVDTNGTITTVGTGKATITVKAYNGKGGKCKVTVLGAPTSIAFPTDELSISTGLKKKLAPDVTYSGKKKADAGITYAISAKSKDAGCVKLNAKTGEITGVRKGSAIITATTYNNKKASLKVTVAAAPKAISLSDKAVTLGVKDVYSGLLAKLTLPAGETSCASTVTWTTSNKKVVKVDANGIITGVKKGKATITATTVNGLKASCKVTVCKAPKKITLKPVEASLKVGESNQFTVTFPKHTAGTVTFKSSDKKIATIDARGKVTAVSKGTVTITASCFNGPSATAKLIVGDSDVDLPPTEFDPTTPEVTEYREDMTNAEKLEYVIHMAQTQLGKPYIYGSGYTKADNPKGFDCSGLVYWSFLRVKVKLKATAHKQGYDGTYQKITKISSLKRGDVVCFNTVDDGKDDLCDHTGIYLGKGQFIHASSSARKVIVSNLSSGYYYRNFYCGRRILP